MFTGRGLKKATESELNVPHLRVTEINSLFFCLTDLRLEIQTFSDKQWGLSFFSFPPKNLSLLWDCCFDGSSFS